MYKQKHIDRRKARPLETYQAAVLEGTTYQSGVQFCAEQEDDLNQ